MSSVSNSEKLASNHTPKCKQLELQTKFGKSFRNSGTKLLPTVVNKGQETDYWCAPAAVQIALSAKMSNPPSQSTIAAAIGTTANGTNFSVAINRYMNRLIHGSGDGYELRWCGNTSQQQLFNCVVNNIDQGYAPVANGCSKGNWSEDSYIPGYPLTDIWHYVAVTGYKPGYVQIADPAWKLPSFNIQKYYFLSIREFRAFISVRGIFW